MNHRVIQEVLVVPSFVNSCDSDQFCDDGECVACIDNSDCSGCQKCVEGACVDDCPDCQQCIGNNCVNPCNPDNCQICTGVGCTNRCTEGQTCDGNGECIGDPSCTTSTECDEDNCEECTGGQCVNKCDSDEFCDGSGECVACRNDDDCSGCQSCINGTCTDNDENCDFYACEECSNGSCVDWCPGQGLYCDGAGQCVECLDDSHCQSCKNCDPETHTCGDLFVEFAANTSYIPTIVHIIDQGDWSTGTNPSPVTHNATVTLRVVVEKIVGTQSQGYFSDFPTSVDIPGLGTVQPLSECGNLAISWKKIMPQMTPSSGKYNDPWNPGYLLYTNVVSGTSTSIPTCQCPHSHTYSRPNTGSFLGNLFGRDDNDQHTCDKLRGVQSRGFEGNGCAIVEYDHTDAGSSWEKTVDQTVGVTHYMVSVTAGLNTWSTRGKRTENTVSHLIYDKDDPAQAYNRGVKNLVMRIVRLSNNASVYLRHVESYNLVPWIYGSWSWQAKDYIGFDCADLAQAAAFNAGLSGAYEASAHGLATGRPDRGGYGILYLENGVIKKRSDGQAANISIGTGENDAHPGDLILVDYGPDGIYDHTMIVYSDSGTLNGVTEMIYARGDGVKKTSLSTKVNDKKYNLVLRQGW